MREPTLPVNLPAELRSMQREIARNRRMLVLLRGTGSDTSAIEADIAALEATVDSNTASILSHAADISAIESDISSIETSITNLSSVSTGTVTLASGWSNAGGAHATAQVRKSPVGFVTVQGRISNTSGAAKASGSLVATVSSGFRPSAAHTTAQITNDGNRLAWVTIFSNGEIYAYHIGGTGGSLTSGSYLHTEMTYHVNG